jgi:hypothetical protein
MRWRGGGGGAEICRRAAGRHAILSCWPRAGAAGGSRAGAWRAARENNAAGQPGADSRAGGAGGSAGRSAAQVRACQPTQLRCQHTRGSGSPFFNAILYAHRPKLWYARCPDLSWIPIVPELVEAMLVVDDERQEQTVAARDCSYNNVYQFMDEFDSKNCLGN